MNREQPAGRFLAYGSFGGVLLIAGLLLTTGAGCSKQELRSNDFSAEPVRIESQRGQERAGPDHLVTRRHVSNFKLCAQRALDIDPPELKGQRLGIRFQIDSAGKARQVGLLTPRFAGTAYAQCVERIVQWIRFPEPDDGRRDVKLWLVLDEEAPLVGDILAGRRRHR